METKSLKLLCVLLQVICFVSLSFADIKLLTEGNWTDMLEGEWLVKFYAPWCPACRSLEPTWEKLSQRSVDLNMKFAKIDVTENAVLSGRFFIVALPTIFHVKDGVIRQYKGQRAESEIVSFIRDELWKETEPVPWYISPTSVHMAAVGQFFRFSITIRDVHTLMTSEYGIPVWGSYIIFAVATILFGLLLGLFIVFLCDAVQFTRSRRRPVRVHSRSPPSNSPTDGAAAADSADTDEANDDDDDNDYDLSDDTKPGSDSTRPKFEAKQSGSGGDTVSSKDVPGLAAETGVRRRDANPNARD